MIRTFKTNQVRKTEELSGSGWTFSPHSGPHKGEHFPVTVPCCWESLPNFSAYRGTSSFETTFWGGGRVRLVFKGISHTGIIYVDGHRIGSHYNAYTPFAVMAENLPEGEHQLRVEVDNAFSEKSALHIPNDYMTYGGISRGVVLEHIAGAYIEYIHGTPKRSVRGWDLMLTARICNPEPETKTYRLMLEAKGLGAAGEDIRLGAGETAEYSRTISVGEVREWAPESPVLYDISALLLEGGKPVDDLIDRVGFRQVEIRGKDILLNGKRLRIKGFCRHEDHPQFCCALSLGAIAQDIQIAVDLGANAIRTTHYPNDECFLDLCDEQGILVWEENHARGLKEHHMRNPYFEQQEEACTEEMVLAHKNHPCIIMWGILNECASETEYGRACYKKQYEMLARLDPSRPRTSASNKHKKDICLDLPEIISFNLYPEWYDDQAEDACACLRDMVGWLRGNSVTADKPFLVSEIGAGAIYGYRTPTLCKWSEEYQALALEHQMRAVLENQECSGLFVWQLTDVRISRERFDNRPRTMNNKGIVDEYRRRKLAYAVVKEIYRSYGTYF